MDKTDKYYQKGYKVGREQTIKEVIEALAEIKSKVIPKRNINERRKENEKNKTKLYGSNGLLK